MDSIPNAKKVLNVLRELLCTFHIARSILPPANYLEALLQIFAQTPPHVFLPLLHRALLVVQSHELNFKILRLKLDNMLIGRQFARDF